MVKENNTFLISKQRDGRDLKYPKSVKREFEKLLKVLKKSVHVNNPKLLRARITKIPK